MSKKLRLILIAVLAVIFVVSTTMYISQLVDKQRSKDIYDNALDIALGIEEAEAEEALAPQLPLTTWIPAPLEEEDPQIEKMEKINLDALREHSEDVVGWVRIPNLEDLDYPIMQGEDNTYYLDHAWNGDENYTGSIFLECLNKTSFTDYNTIVYGHNMRNQSMFGALHLFRDQSLLQYCPYVYIRTDEGVLRYEVFAAFYAPLESPIYGLSFNQEETKVKFLEYAKEHTEITVDFEPALTDRILTLSTCTKSNDDMRWVVLARLNMVEVPLEEVANVIWSGETVSVAVPAQEEPQTEKMPPEETE